MKQKVITKESKGEFKDRILIEKKIKKLKKEFLKYTKSRVGEMYKILSKIVKLKQKINSGFRPRSLEWEDDIKLNAMQIRYIFSYQYISSYSKKLIEKGLINDSAVCFLIYRFKMLREPQWQNKIVKLFLNGKITISQSSEMTREELVLLLNGKFKFKTDDKYLISATKTLRSILVRIKQRKNIINKSKYKKNLIQAVNKLGKELK